MDRPIILSNDILLVTQAFEMVDKTLGAWVS
jgi:hypothetical protein